MLFKWLVWQNRNSGNLSSAHSYAIHYNKSSSENARNNSFLAIRCQRTSNLKKKKPKQPNPNLICSCLIKCSATEVPMENNYHSIIGISLVPMTGFTAIDSFSAACSQVFVLESHHFRGKHVKKSEGENFFIILEDSLLPLSLSQIPIHPHLMSPMI